MSFVCQGTHQKASWRRSLRPQNPGGLRGETRPAGSFLEGFFQRGLELAPRGRHSDAQRNRRAGDRVHRVEVWSKVSLRRPRRCYPQISSTSAMRSSTPRRSIPSDFSETLIDANVHRPLPARKERHADPVQTTFDPPYAERNGAVDPILGVFFGRIPCAIKGCEMRKVELVLYGSEQVPTTYWLGQVGVGMGNGWLVQQGTWTGRRGVQGIRTRWYMRSIPMPIRACSICGASMMRFCWC
jgi:hypothetical protein